jgi:DNA end-binding protein Ku
MPARRRSTSKRKSGRKRTGETLPRPIWRGVISLGLVSIPVALRTATTREELKFHLLRKSDLSPVNYKRVAAVDGKEVPWEEIVKGYEYEKGKYVVLKDDDFKRVDIEATDTMEIMDFVLAREIDPAFFMRPYYFVPERGGATAYALLRDVLSKSDKVGIAKVVIRTRQHLAAVKTKGDALMLELMHFADEIIGSSSMNIPTSKSGGRREREMAAMLVDQMTTKWDPNRYSDDYSSALMKLIKQKVKSGGRELPSKPKRKQADNVIDLAAELQKSLDAAGQGKKSSRASGKRRARAA